MYSVPVGGTYNSLMLALVKSIDFSMSHQHMHWRKLWVQGE